MSRLPYPRSVSRQPAILRFRLGWRKHSALALASVLCLSGLLPSPARAQAVVPQPGADDSNATAARTREATEWFVQGRSLMDEGRYAEAAQAFEKSQALAASASTLLNLGNAYARQGDVARALQTFERALTAADKATSEAQRQALTTAAQSQIETLRPRVASLAITAPQTAGVSVQLNGQTLPPGTAPLRLNPGLYRLEATAPGKLPHAETLRLEAGQVVELRIPPLADAAPVASEPTLAPAPTPPVTLSPITLSPITPPRSLEPAPEPASGPRFGVLPWILAGGGAGLVGVSLITGLSAKSKADEVKQACPTLRNCDLGLQDEYDGAKALGLATDVLWIAGVAGVAAGVTLLIIRAGDAEPAELQAACSIQGCTLQGRF